jgi:hypothetical protein
MNCRSPPSLATARSGPTSRRATLVAKCGRSPSRPVDLSGAPMQGSGSIARPRGGTYPQIEKSRAVKTITDRIRHPMTRRASQVSTSRSLQDSWAETCFVTQTVLMWLAYGSLRIARGGDVLPDLSARTAASRAVLQGWSSATKCSKSMAMLSARCFALRYGVVSAACCTPMKRPSSS